MSKTHDQSRRFVTRPKPHNDFPQPSLFLCGAAIGWLGANEARALLNVWRGKVIDSARTLSALVHERDAVYCLQDPDLRFLCVVTSPPRLCLPQNVTATSRKRGCE